MSASGDDRTGDKAGDAAAEGEGHSQSSSSLPGVELPRKRKGDVEERQSEVEMEDDLSRSEAEDLQVKMRCFREPHRQIEKRRRDKMNNLIDELSSMIPACQPMARKLDKLTVLRKAVQHLKALRGGTSGAFVSTYKPSILPDDDLRHLLLRAADGFLLVVTCDRAKILFISESVSNVLNFKRVALTGKSLFDFIHPKDISKVKEQLSASELNPRHRVIDAATGAQVQTDSPVRMSHLSTGARRSFFCRMKHSRAAGKHEDKSPMPSTSKKKDTYCTLHCTGYMRSWPTSQLESESDADKDNAYLTCLVTMCRIHPQASYQPPTDVLVKPTEFVTRFAIDGKFTFVDQQATTVIGYLPQEVLGTSCYEYFHQEDLQHLAEKHRQVLRSKEKIETRSYRFRTKYGHYISLQSQWFSFTNPWTKEVEFIVSSNRVISGSGQSKDDKVAGSSKALTEETKPIPIIPGLSSGVGTMIFAGSIGTQIANELMDSYRVNSSPSSGAPSPFGSSQDKWALVTPGTSRSAGSRDEASTSSQSQSGSRAVGDVSREAQEHPGESSQLDLDNITMPGLSCFTSDEAAMAVIMSLLETDVNMGQQGDFEDLHWSM